MQSFKCRWFVVEFLIIIVNENVFLYTYNNRLSPYKCCNSLVVCRILFDFFT